MNKILNIKKGIMMLLTAIIFCSGTALFGSCTTQVDLCDEDHPHLSGLRYKYDWSKLTELSLQPPQRMTVLLDRVINAKRTVNEYFSNKADSLYSVESGTYKFFTFNRTNSDFTFDTVDEYLIDFENYDHEDLWVSYITYDDSELAAGIPGRQIGDGMVKDFADENSYNHVDGEAAKYVNYEIEPLVADSFELTEFEVGKQYEIPFKPYNLSHNIDIYFDLSKEISSDVQFTIDSVYCILSGIPHSVNMQTQELDINSTDKLLYKSRNVSPDAVPSATSAEVKDTRTTAKTRWYQNVNVLGIVKSNASDEDVFGGPGILQVVIYTTVYDATHPNGRKVLIQGLINIYKSLETAQLQILNKGKWFKSREHSDLYIEIDQTITTDMLYGKDNGGIPNWKVIDWNEENDTEIEV